MWQDGTHNIEYHRYLAQATHFKCRIMHTLAPYIQHKKILQTARRLADREFDGGTVCTVRQRPLSAVTAQGVCTRYQTMQALCPRIYVSVDPYGAASALLMSQLYRLAMAAGESVTVGRCVLLPDGAPEHLLLPEKGVAFTVSNDYHTVDFPVYRRIHTLLYTDTQALQVHQETLEGWQRRLRCAVQRAILSAPRFPCVKGSVKTEDFD